MSARSETDGDKRRRLMRFLWKSDPGAAMICVHEGRVHRVLFQGKPWDIVGGDPESPSMRMATAVCNRPRDNVVR